MTDPIADMLTRIRNAIMARHEWTDMPYSTVKFSIAKLLKEEGYLRNYKVFVDEARKKFIKVYIGYDERIEERDLGSAEDQQARQAGLREGPGHRARERQARNGGRVNIQGPYDR